MTHYTFNPHTLRITKARASRLIHPTGRRLLQILAGLLIAIAMVFVLIGQRQGISLAGIGLSLVVLLIWIRRDISILTPAPIDTTTNLDQLLPASLAAQWQDNLTGAELWRLLSTTPEAYFLIARFDLLPDTLTTAMTSYILDTDTLITKATELSHQIELPTLDAAIVICALFNLHPPLTSQLTAVRLTPDDLLEGARWLARLRAYQAAPKPLYGGLARDWAAGFTPLLSRFGTNISSQAQYGGKYLRAQERTEQLDSLITALDSATGSVVLVGEPGIGKSALLLGLADRLLQDSHTQSLKHHQIIALNASIILSSAQMPGDIENIVLGLLNEAIHATNIVIALDEAQLFFGQGTGAVNLSQILLPVLQSRRLKLVLALTPGDWQRLRATNAAMSSLLTPLVLAEPDQAHTLRLLADRAIFIEQRHIITWSAITEAYRLSGRYLQDEAYPGRAFKLLEAALNHPEAAFITNVSVQQAVESQFGVKVQTASTQESDILLNLEDHIHQRMINQTRAVQVVASALRRARAGVANPKRPIGSFLFLGPTGVGKTELAKSIAALYFNAESSLIRLDMSEYQQIADVDRLLQSAAQNPSGLLPAIRQNPFSVVLFDEIEKAHPNLLNLFLQLLDEGNLTDISGRPASFKDAIIIATSNAGADEIRRHIEAGETLESFEDQFTNDLINAGTFRPELLNRFDEIVLFRPLSETELTQVVNLMIKEVNRTLEPQKIQVSLTPEAIQQLVATGYDPRLGARPMRRMVTRRVEDAVARQILSGQIHPGDTLTLDAKQLAPAAAPTSDRDT